MTDNRTTEQTATERLRALLDERGVEYEAECIAFSNCFTWGENDCYSYTEYLDGTVLRIWDCTPEQAIAATLGCGTLTAEQVREAIKANSWAETSSLLEFNDSSWQAIADELNATPGRGTCEIETTENWLPAERYHRCKHCGAFFAVLDASGDIPPCVCPNCGKRVKRREQ